VTLLRPEHELVLRSVLLLACRNTKRLGRCDADLDPSRMAGGGA